jgi:flagellar basal-body rod modification protein FlgD
MVGQMISLNQLEQLISINQTITGSSTSSSGTTANAVQAAGTTASTLSPSAAGAATSQLPFDPNTMMPLGFSNSGAAASSTNSTLNPAMMGFSGSGKTASGGK